MINTMTLYTICISDDIHCKHINDVFYILCDDDISTEKVAQVCGEYIDYTGYLTLCNEDYDVTLDNVLNFIDSDDDVNMSLAVNEFDKFFYFFQ